MSSTDERAKRSFRSDNNAGLCPEALRAITSCAAGHAVGYGGDEWTTRAEARFRDLFGEDSRVFFVATGTIANNLAIAAMTEPWQRVLCHSNSHWNDDESTAPELFTRCRTTTIESQSSKLTVDDLDRAASVSRGDVHQPQPGVLTISNATEFGEVYTPEETRALAEAAHDLGYRVHVDGARFANAVARLSCEPRALGGDAGVDALSFGGTKNGLAFGEAVVFFEQPHDPSLAQRAAKRFPYLRKGAGALLSKHRFVAAQFAETLEDGAWLSHAGRANAMADRLARGLSDLGLRTPYRTEANAVFVELPKQVDAHLRARGHGYYVFDPARNLARLMCSFDTTEQEVDALVADARAAYAKA